MKREIRRSLNRLHRILHTPTVLCHLWQKKPEFLEKYKKLSAQEWKNGEMKRFHGLSRARGWGLRSILFQAKLTAIAVNLKRIAAITGKKTLPVIAVFKKIEDYFQKLILNTDFATIFLLADC